MEILKSEHKRPEHSAETMLRSANETLHNWFGDRLAVCGYCGLYHVKQYVCSCGFQEVYADEPDKNGNLVLVWSNR